MTAVWFYDYLLTLNDEVAEFHGEDDAQRNLINPHRSSTNGEKAGTPVSEP